MLLPALGATLLIIGLLLMKFKPAFSRLPTGEKIMWYTPRHDKDAREYIILNKD